MLLSIKDQSMIVPSRSIPVVKNYKKKKIKKRKLIELSSRRCRKLRKINLFDATMTSTATNDGNGIPVINNSDECNFLYSNSDMSPRSVGSSASTNTEIKHGTERYSFGDLALQDYYHYGDVIVPVYKNMPKELRFNHFWIITDCNENSYWGE